MGPLCTVLKQKYVNLVVHQFLCFFSGKFSPNKLCLRRDAYPKFDRMLSSFFRLWIIFRTPHQISFLILEFKFWHWSFGTTGTCPSAFAVVITFLTCYISEWIVGVRHSIRKYYSNIRSFGNIGLHTAPLCETKSGRLCRCLWINGVNYNYFLKHICEYTYSLP